MSTNQTLQKYWGRELEREEVSPYMDPTQCGYTAVYKAADVDVTLTEIQQDRDNAIASFNDTIEQKCKLINKLTALIAAHEAGRQAGLEEVDDIERKFKEFADEWRRQKGLISSVTLISMIPSYQRIIGLGRGVIPLILKELERQPDHWFYALEMLTTEDEHPVSDSEAGNMNKMAAAWVRWGKAKEGGT